MQAIEKYLRRGWALFPVAPGAKTPLIGRAHAPDVRCRGRVDGCLLDGHGCLDATTDRDRIAAWWSRWPAANIGIATGAPSGFWVLDYDPAGAIDGGAQQVIHGLEFAGLEPHVQTGGGGLHWRFALPDDFEVTNRRGTLPAGLDVRGTGGYVVAPPSVSGKGAYAELPTLGDGSPYVAPTWLLDMIRPTTPLPRGEPPAGWSPSTFALPDIAGGGSADRDRGQRYARAAVDSMLAALAATPSGRNAAAFTAACRILEFANAGWLDAEAAFGAWEAATLAHPLGVVVPASEILSLLRSAQRTVGDRPAFLDTPDPLAVRALGPPLPPWEPPPFPGSGNGAASSPERPTLASPGLPVGPANGTDPRWEAVVQAEISRTLARREAARRLAAADAVPTGALRGRLLDTAAMLARPRLVPIVDGLLYRGTVARINGAPGSGKTFVSLDLAARISTGMPWCGREVARTTVVYVLAEGGGGAAGRIEAWQAHHGRPVEVLWLPSSVQIGGPEWDAWCDIWAERQAGLVVLDTQARATVGRDEIDGRDMGEVLAALDALAVRLDACPLLVHHTPVGGNRARGHGSMTGGLQTELLVTKVGREITVRATKGKDDDDDLKPWIFDLTDVMPSAVDGRPVLANAAPIGVVPVWRGERPVEAPSGESARTTRARQLWQVIHDRYNPGMGGTYAEIRQAWADVAWTDRPTTGTAGNAYRKAWARAWADLIQLGLVARQYGAARFKVVVLSDQKANGVLTPNRNGDGQLISEGPTGFEVILTDITESDKGV